VPGCLWNLKCTDFPQEFYFKGVAMKLSCKQIVRRLPGYIEGGLDDRQYRQLSAHVRRCKHCGIVSDSVRHTMAIYEDRTLLEFEPGLVQSVPVTPHIGK
jgi:Putative zinc-finger